VGLYLCVFASADVDDEVDGIEVGSYDDFHEFRATVADRLEARVWGSRFPVLMGHPDSDGEWSPAQSVDLCEELFVVRAELAALPPVPFADGTWQSKVAGTTGLAGGSLLDHFIDVDGEPLLDRFIQLARASAALGSPILLQ
jgi:hypothetical protein